MRLFNAAERGDILQVQTILEDGFNPNEKDSHGNTPLHRAIWYGPTEYSNNYQKVVEALLNAGADVNAINNYGQTPLHKAAQLGKRDLAKLLVERDPDINTKDGMGNTPLHETAVSDDKIIAELLLSKKADIDARNNFEKTPLEVADKLHSTQVGKVLQINRPKIIYTQQHKTQL